MRHPAALEAELAVVADVRERHPSLGLVAPFVTDDRELAWFYRKAEELLGANPPVASMVDTPGAMPLLPEILDAGARHVIVGTNDLTSLLLARGRAPLTTTEASPALERALTLIREVTAERGVSMTVAGYLSEGLLASAERVGADYAAVHYCDLPRLFGYRDLPHIDHVRSVKQKTQSAIARLSGARGSGGRG